MEISESHSLGTYPTIQEVIDYYLRPDILSQIHTTMRVRDVTFAYRLVGRERVENTLHATDVDELEGFLRRFFTQYEGQLEAYPWFTTATAENMEENAAYEYDPRTGERRIIGWDMLIELDYGWRQSFGELYSAMQVLDDFGIHYRLKFSGHRSLHLILPAESMPGSLREQPDLEEWTDAIGKVREFLSERSNHLSEWMEPEFWHAYSAPYTVHRYVGLVAIPLMPSDLQDFRPWMASIYLARPVPNWWDVPPQAEDNFGKLLDYIESGREVFDVHAYSAKGESDRQGVGYVPRAIRYAQELSRTFPQSPDALCDEDVRLRRWAAWTFMIHEANDITNLLTATNDRDKVVRWFALEAIQRSINGGLADEKDLVCAAEKLLNDSDEYVRQAALDLLIGFGESSIERLLQKFAAGDRSWPSWEALWTLVSWVKAQGEAGIEVLMKFVRGNDIDLQDSALFVLGRIARFAAHRLIELLSDDDEYIRIGSLIALLELGEDAAPFLQMAVETKEERTCMLARQALDGLEKLRANEHLRMTIPSPRIARLTAIGGELALSALSRELRSANSKNRFMASKAFIYIGQTSVPILIDSLGSPDTDLRRRACEALRDIASPEARDALREVLRDPDIAVRQNAVRALARIGNPDDLSAIRSLLHDPSRTVRRTARQALETTS